MKDVVEQIRQDPRYMRNIEYGEPRAGHPEGKIRVHIADLERNLERLRPHLACEEDYWRLMVLIHVHDTFKAEAEADVPIKHPRSHASLARAFAAEYIDDRDLLNMVQYHDEGYALWRQMQHRRGYDTGRLRTLLETIADWDLFLAFTIIDGSTEGKDRRPLEWFIKQVRRHRPTRVDESWLL